MLSGLLKGLIGPVLDGVTKLIPDKNARAEAREQAEAQMLTGMMSIVQGQLDINKTEATHKSLFVAGWRPAVGWVCAIGLGWNFILQPLISWGAFLVPGGVDLSGAPQLEIGELMTLLMGMLGLGGMRTYEKRIGKAADTMPTKKKKK